MVCSSHVGFRVEGVTEASLTSDVFVACLFSPSASSEAVRKLREPQPGGVSGSETVCPQVHLAATPRILNFS